MATTGRVGPSSTPEEAQMKELFTMWRSTQMIVLVALIAAVYAAVLIPFKAIPLVPGFTEIRVAQIIPPVAALLFGPAAAWGTAFGNLIGDYFGGTLTIASTFGFAGNFFLGAIPYVLWGRLGPLSSGEAPEMKNGKQIGEFIALTAISGIACAAIIAWGLEILNLFPFTVLGTIIAINNVVLPAAVGWIVLRLLYGRVQRMGLIWSDIMAPGDVATTGPAGLGTLLIVVGSLGGWVVGMGLSLMEGGLLGAPGFAQFGEGETMSVIAGVAPFMAAVLVGAFLARSRPDLFSLDIGEQEPEAAPA
jgi:energy-coupling factor transport system substrate-specific component